MKRTFRLMLGLLAAATLAVGIPATASAATPIVTVDDGAYVRVVGNPAEGTIKFQYGWEQSTPASDAAGYWVGVYDVTNSHYLWNFDTGPISPTSSLMRNAHPTANLPPGDYKIVFFVRGGYEPTWNISEIEFPFTVTG